MEEIVYKEEEWGEGTDALDAASIGETKVILP